MKNSIIIVLFLFFSMKLWSQTQSVQYQAVVRDASGTALINQPVNFQISIISGSTGGTVEYTETHSASTNPFGIATLEIGNGIPVSGSFATISWGTASHFIKVEADPTGGTTYIDMGTTQLLSVPYALYSEQAGNVQTYSAGNGISISGNVVTNEAPDQAVTLTPGGATTISGTYPNFTISSTDNNTTYTAGSGINVTGTTINNTAPDQAVSLTQGGATTITGTYPNFTISSTDNNTTYTAGTAINISGTTINNTAPDQTVSLTQGGATTITGTYPNFTISSTDQNTGTPGGSNKTLQFNNNGSFGGDTSLIWDNSNKRLGLGVTNPFGRVVIQGSQTAMADEPLFEIRNRFGQQIMVVYEDSVHFYISDDVISSNKGGFAVSGRNNAKSLTNDFLTINPDSTRVYTSDMVKGFGVRNIAGSSKTSYMQLTPDNYFIGHKSGTSMTTGLYNNFMGFEAGLSNTSGYYNVFLGYNSGRNSSTGSGNTFIGFASGYNSNGSDNVAVGSNTLGISNNGNSNVAVGNASLAYNTSGSYNVAVGNNSLNANTIGERNVAIGDFTLSSNSSGSRNVALGCLSLQNNTSGLENVSIGNNAGYTNSTGSSNVFIGYYAGYTNNANYNVFIGYRSGRNNSTGSNNVFMGYNSGRSNSTGSSSVFIGDNAGYTNTVGNYNTAFGFNALYYNLNGSNNCANGYLAMYSNYSGNDNAAYGTQALYFNTSGIRNTALGYQSLYDNIDGNYNTATGNASLANNSSGWSNTASGDQALYNNTAGGSNVGMGVCALYSNTNGSNNTAVGINAFFLGSSYTNSTAVGNSANITASNQVRVGNNAVTSIGGQVGWTTLSDARFKQNVKSNVPGLDFIKKLNPVTYTIDTELIDDYIKFPDSLRMKEGYAGKRALIQSGFIAQEVEQAAKETGYNFSGVDKPKNENDYYGLRYGEFTVPIVKAIQEQQIIIEQLIKENNELKIKINEISKLKTEIEYLKNIVQNQK